MDSHKVNYRSSKGGYQLKRTQKRKQEQQQQQQQQQQLPMFTLPTSASKNSTTSYTRKAKDQPKSQRKRQQQQPFKLYTSPIIDEVFGKKNHRKNDTKKKRANVTSIQYSDTNIFQSKRKKLRTIVHQQQNHHQQQQSNKYIRNTTNGTTSAPYAVSSSSSTSSTSAMTVKFFEMKLPNIKLIYDTYDERNRSQSTKEMLSSKDKSNGAAVFPCWRSKLTSLNDTMHHKSSNRTSNSVITSKSSIYDVIDHIRSSDRGVQYDVDMNEIVQYIQLTEDEIKLRNQFVSLLEHEVQQQLQVRVKHPNINDNGSAINDKCCHIFGSYASVPICTFQSDLDVALFNVIDAYDNRKKSQSSKATTEEQQHEGNEEPDDRKEATTTVTATPPAINLTKQQRKAILVEKWRKLLDTAENGNIDDNGKANGAENSSQPSRKRKRNSADDNDDETNVVEEMIDNTVDVDAEVEVTDDDDDDIDDPMKRYYQQQTNNSKRRNRAYSDSTILSTKSEEDYDEDSYDSSDEKSANDRYGSDLTVSFFVSKPPVLARAAAVGGTSMGPQGHIRLEVIQVLKKLCNKLRKNNIRRSMKIDNITFIKTAKVPIIKLELLSGFNVDIAIGGFGTDTSLYAAQQIQLYPTTFTHVVVIVKTLLSQHKLDEPFTGGLGSYKLYILIADHIYQHKRWCMDHTNHLAMRRSDNQECVPFEILLTFFYRYGYGSFTSDMVQHQNQHRYNKPPLFPYPTTPLDQNKPFISSSALSTLGSDSANSICNVTSVCADLSNVYKLKDCIVLFRLCFDRLYQQMIQPRQNSDGTYPRILTHVICPFQLQTNRERILHQTKLFVHSTSTNSTVNDETKKKPATTAISSRSGEQLPLLLDRTKEEILDGYKNVFC